MTELTARQIKALETKKSLLEKGLELFHEKGFDNVTVESIAKACNVSKGAFYVHYSSKYDIFLEKFKDIDNFYLSFVPSIPTELSASEKIILFYQGQMTYLRDVLGKDFIRTIYTSALALTIDDDHYLTNQNRQLYQIIHSFVEEGIERNEFRQDFSANYISMLITRCMRGTIYDWIIFRDRLDPVVEIQSMTSAVLDGLKSTK
ncbi:MULTISPECIES: TetR/AcrR family transcriptional regulator [Sporosarcina]|uniref:TetR/AcrR family transcriptional regulator n=1 Tax=Sporosarcina TaxID=1569 RepID=UPI000A17C559|nr:MULTISPECIES: TetR/AcrR family transcriptional regulator [Sporosarcina]ARK22302.1 TetR family transcriptional regulator [Sporosarcina ureae]PIC74227.1 TetR/AcrR family transcriptional regulator [Sporosarcina sp. P17b]